MKNVFIFIFCLIVCLCILNYNNKDATFDIEQYLNNINENVSYMPLPPSISDFKSYNEIRLDNDYGYTRAFFAFIGETFATIFNFIVFPFKMIWFFITNLKVIFGDLLLWS